MMSARTFFRTHASALAFSVVTLAMTVAAGAIFGVEDGVDLAVIADVFGGKRFELGAGGGEVLHLDLRFNFNGHGCD